MEKFLSTLTCQNYRVSKNTITFLQEKERPVVCQKMDSFYLNKRYPMGHMYHAASFKFKDDKAMQHYYNFILANKGICVDLASGASGYFGPILFQLHKEMEFVISDASKVMIKAHSTANLKRRNVVILDIDLNQLLPIKNNSIDMYCGYLVNNVQNYIQLVQEVARTLKISGKFVIIEWFFESTSITANFLQKNHFLIQSLEYYICFCESIGLKLMNKELQSQSKGKLTNDLLPVDENDKKSVYILYFEKVK